MEDVAKIWSFVFANKLIAASKKINRAMRVNVLISLKNFFLSNNVYPLLCEFMVVACLLFRFHDAPCYAAMRSVMLAYSSLVNTEHHYYLCYNAITTYIQEANMTTMTIRVDAAEKKRASEIAEYYGFDLSSVTRAFWKQMIRERRVPLNLGNYEPNEASQEAIAEVDEMIKAKTSRFETADEAIAALKA